MFSSILGKATTLLVASLGHATGVAFIRLVDWATDRLSEEKEEEDELC